MALLLLFVLIHSGCGGGSVEEIETADKVPVVTAAARIGAIRQEIIASGRLEPSPGAELVVTAPETARILELPKAEGDAVAKGDLLVRFEIPSLESAMAARRSDVARAEARLEGATLAATRAEGLFDRGIAARREVEEAHRELAEANAAVAEARSGLEAAEALEQRETVRAGFAGIIAARWHNPGDLVEPGSGNPILRIIDPSRIQVQAQVSVTGLPGPAPGSPARVLVPGTSVPEAATVVGTASSVDPATGAVLVRLSLDRPTMLPSGTPVEVVILGEERRAALLVPASAIVREGEETFIFVVEGGTTARRRAVQVGVVAGGNAEIVSGAAAGEVVIAQGQGALPDGAAVVTAP